MMTALPRSLRPDVERQVVSAVWQGRLERAACLDPDDDRGRALERSLARLDVRRQRRSFAHRRQVHLAAAGSPSRKPDGPARRSF